MSDEEFVQRLAELYAQTRNSYVGAQELQELLDMELLRLIALARNGIRYNFLVEHDPVGLEEMMGLIRSKLERGDVPKIMTRTMQVERIMRTSGKLFLFGSFSDYFVVAEASQVIELGDTIEYEPYGASNWGTFRAIVIASFPAARDDIT